MNNMLGMILIGCMCLTNCTAKKQTGKDTVVFEQFPKVSKIGFEQFLKFDQGTARKLYLTDSALIVCSLQGGVTDYFFYRYSLRNKTLSAKYVKGGRGRGQALNAFSSGLYKKNTVWLHDISLNKLLTFNLAETNDGDSLAFHEYAIPEFFYSVQLMDSLHLLVAGAYHTPSKINQLDLSSGKQANEYGSFPNAPSGIPFYSWKRAYEGFLFLKPTENKAVLACRYADQIEIFDLAAKQSKIIKGPENYEPAFTPMKVQGMDIIQRNDKTRFAFVNGMVTNRYIYLLYSGNPHDSKYQIEGKCIYVYDWDGNPVGRFDLDRYISGFTVSDDDAVMYAFDPATGYILKTQFNR